MQLPANNSLQLHDIHLPDPAGWWPPAPGWWILALVIVITVVWLSRQAYAWFKYRNWHKQIMTEFNHFDSIDETRLLTQVTEKLRQLAMTVYPEQEVASLTGKSWLEFLDTHARHKGFSQHPAKLIIDAPYSGTAVDLTDKENQQLIELVKDWAQYNSSRQNYRRLTDREHH